MLLISEPGRGKTANINVPAKFIKEIEILNNTIQHEFFGRTLTSHIGLASQLLDWGNSVVSFTEKNDASDTSAFDLELMVWQIKG